ncbi:peptidoglycan-binding protein [Peribacillus simplex]|uniref:peptidoglycan-binding domain-containing protein n=1 Tax=Peribacillus TaxID=2675229 RepID=UPI001786DF40|nr:peptidoglycan-binding domain-containing protein [Brevibacillus sp. JNUCC-41]QOS88669.1 peptidoglycan-binding protein [Brevibacillus sp. JNUCC-41]
MSRLKKVLKAILLIMQAALYLEGFNPGSLDSIFGKGTESTLSKFQKAKKVTADKKAGKATFQ